MSFIANEIVVYDTKSIPNELKKGESLRFIRNTPIYGSVKPEERIFIVEYGAKGIIHVKESKPFSYPRYRITYEVYGDNLVSIKNTIKRIEEVLIAKSTKKPEPTFFERIKLRTLARKSIYPFAGILR